MLLPTKVYVFLIDQLQQVNNIDTSNLFLHPFDVKIR